MRTVAAACILGATLLLLSGTSNARKSKAGTDPLLELDKEDYGVSLVRNRTLYDYSSAQDLKNADPSSTRIFVTTRDRMPDGTAYPIAEAVSKALKATFPLTEFRVAGRTNMDEFVQSVREHYDYVFVIGTYSKSRDYDSEQTTYSSRSTGVRCKPDLYGDGVSCNESSSISIPTGSRTVKGTIFTDLFNAEYGPAESFNKALSTDVETKASNWIFSNSSAIGNTSITLRYGTSDASWCDNIVAAQTRIAGMTGVNLVSVRPDEFSIDVEPDEIGCED